MTPSGMDAFDRGGWVPGSSKPELNLMTAAEHGAMDLTLQLDRLMVEIIGDGPVSAADLRASRIDLHHIQHRILRQAAGRAYPDRYRMLGGDVPAPATAPSPSVDQITTGRERGIDGGHDE